VALFIKRGESLVRRRRRMTFSILDVVNEDTCITSLTLYL
jgi:hypothetical protein